MPMVSLTSLKDISLGREQLQLDLDLRHHVGDEGGVGVARGGGEPVEGRRRGAEASSPSAANAMDARIRVGAVKTPTSARIEVARRIYRRRARARAARGTRSREGHRRRRGVHRTSARERGDGGRRDVRGYQSLGAVGSGALYRYVYSTGALCLESKSR